MEKYLWHECPKTYGGRDYLSTWSRHSSVLGHSCHEFFHLHDKNGGCRAENFRHRGQIQTGTVPKKLSCKPGLRHLSQPWLPVRIGFSKFKVFVVIVRISHELSSLSIHNYCVRKQLWVSETWDPKDFELWLGQMRKPFYVENNNRCRRRPVVERDS